MDDYYAQFEERVSQSLVDRSGPPPQTPIETARMDNAYATDYEESPRHMPDEDYNVIQELQRQAFMQKQAQLEQALKQKHLEEQLIEEELSLLKNRQPEMPASGFVQQVALPHGIPDDKAYMYSSVMSDVSS